MTVHQGSFTDPLRKVELWEHDRDREQLRPFESPHEAMEDWFDTFWIGDPANPGQPKQDSPMPRTKEVYGYTRRTIDHGDMPDFLDGILEALGEEHGDPDDYGYGMDPTDGMKAAARALEDAIIADYVPWFMERVTTEKIDVVEWAQENAADVFPRIKWSEEDISHD